MQHWLRGLSEQVFDSVALRVPKPLGVADDLRMVLLEYIDGSDLRYVLGRPDEQAAFQLAGLWLARLHNAEPLQELRTGTPQDEIRKVLGWLDRIAAVLPMSSAAHERAMRGDLSDAYDHLRSIRLTMVHHDFYYANLLWDGTSLWGVDFDQVRVGDPALDVGHFCAHLEVLARRSGKTADAYRRATAAFLDSYGSHAHDQTFQERVALYRSYTFLKLADTEVTRARPAWDSNALDLFNMARQSLRSL
jgi:thiamine kinase-like enzyme